MSLPFSRNTNYNANDPARGNDLNAIQDAIVAHETTTIPRNVKHGDVTEYFSPVYSSTTTGGILRVAGTIYLQLKGLRLGDRVKSISHLYGSSSGASNVAVTVTVYRIYSDIGGLALASLGATWQISATLNTGGAALTGTVTGGGVPYTLGSADHTLVVGFQASVDGYYYGSFVTWDHP